MPYVDQGEPKAPANLPPIVPIVAVVIAGLLGPLLWYGSHLWFGYSYAGALLSGLLVGLAAKFTLKHPFPSIRVIAIILIVLGGFAGYVWVDSKLWTPFMFDQSMQRFFRDFIALLMIGMGCYIAFVLASPRLSAASTGGPAV